MAILGFMRMLNLEEIATTVDQCFNGLELVQLVEKSIEEGDPYRYPLILTDCSMPVMDGYAASQRVRQIFDELPGFATERPNP